VLWKAGSWASIQVGISIQRHVRVNLRISSFVELRDTHTLTYFKRADFAQTRETKSLFNILVIEFRELSRKNRDHE